MMNEEAVKELVQLVRDGVEGAGVRLTEALPVLVEEISGLGKVYVIAGIACLLGFMALFFIARRVHVWCELEHEDVVVPYAFATVVSIPVLILGIVGIVNGLPMLFAPHMHLLKILT